MFPLLADEDFDRLILRGLLLRQPSLDVARVQDLGLAGSPDPEVLERAALEGRVLLTHDFRTMIGFAYARVRRGEAMPGVFAVPQSLATGRAIDDLLILVVCSHEGKWEGQVRYLPL